MMPTRSAEMHEHHPDANADNCNQRLPRHIAIVLDGNGRWAQRRGLSRTKGHEAGTENIRAIVAACLDLGIEYVTFYVFSTENWRRPQDEVRGIYRILIERLTRETEALHRAGVRIKHIGNRANLTPPVAYAIQAAIDRTRNNCRMTLTFAINYGGRMELVHAIREILRDGLDPATVDEATVARYLYTAGMPDPDLIIRPSGEQRLSNFLLWQGAYADLHFTPTLWPDFRPNDLRVALAEHQRRHRVQTDRLADDAGQNLAPPVSADVPILPPHLQRGAETAITQEE